MAEGTIKKLTDKGFGFIKVGNGKDLFSMPKTGRREYEELSEDESVLQRRPRSKGSRVPKRRWRRFFGVKRRLVCGTASDRRNLHEIHG